jgi:hypothetical protein
VKLYATTYIDDDEPDERDERKCMWSGTQDDARKQRNQLKAAGKRSIGTKLIDVPTDKAGLLAYLIRHEVYPIPESNAS